MSTLDKDVYERLYKAIEQTILTDYLIGDQRRWSPFYRFLTEEGMTRYEGVEHKDPQVSVEVNRRPCQNIKVTIILNHDYSNQQTEDTSPQ